MAMLSKLKPMQAVRLLMIAAAIYMSTKVKDQAQRKRLFFVSAIGALIYSLKAPTLPEGTLPEGHQKPLPLIGHLSYYSMFRDSPHNTSLLWARNAKFQTFGISFPDNFSIVALMNHEDRKHFFKTNFANYPKNYNYKFGFNKIFTEIMGEGIFAVDGDKWKTHRKVASFLFTGNMINVTMGNIFIKHGELLRDTLLDFAKKDEEFDIQLLLQSLVFDAFCEIGFGITPGSFESAIKGEKEPFQTAFDNVQINSAQRNVDPPLLRELFKFFVVGGEVEIKEGIKYMDEYIYKIIADRKKGMAENPEKFAEAKDILGLYLNYAKKKNRPELVEDAYLRDMILNFMIAGRDTTSYVMTNILSQLAENPKMQEEVHKEAVRIMKDGNEKLAANVKHFPLGDAVFNESLRMHPSVGTDIRFCKNDDVLPSGVKVKAGTMMLIPNYAIGRDPSLCFEPDSFMPKRWMNKSGQCDRIDEYKYPFFWAGYRICLGKDMARFESKVFMSIILSQVKLSMSRTRLEEFVPGPVMFYKDGVYLKAQPISQ